ncbi:unnamed protein product, partial [Polarella glacialis]
AATWNRVLECAILAVVSLKVTAVRSFQDAQPGAYLGTGFIVDSKQGLLLTSRQVCTLLGPVRVVATLLGVGASEELPASVVYADPVHDFAILRV